MSESDSDLGIPIEDATTLGRTAKVVGTPGSGKSQTVTELVSRAVYAHGVDSVVICSFTTAAAQEIRSRIQAPIPKEQVGTLHSLCYQAIGAPPMHLSKIDEWNALHRQWAVTPDNRRVSAEAAIDDTISPDALGDDLLGQVGVLRNQMVPPSRWHNQQVTKFHEAWEAWKAEVGVVDFTDQLAMALEQVEQAPGNPVCLFVDEAQDQTVLQNAIIRKWAMHCAWTITVGDPDQMIFGWAGSTPEAFLGWETDVTIPWNQSHRVPRGVTDLAVDWIKRSSTRSDVDLLPRDHDGVVEVLGQTDVAGEPFMRRLKGHAAAGESVMVLASCDYMLRPMLKAMRMRGIVSHNPWRLSNGSWNPIPRRRGLTSADRLLAFMRPDEDVWGDRARMWTMTDLWQWIEPMKVKGALRSGAKQWIADHHKRVQAGPLPLNFDRPRSNDLSSKPGILYFFEEQAHKHLFDLDLDWWLNQLTAAKRKAMVFPVTVLRQQGATMLRDTPLIVTGTLHCSPPDELVSTVGDGQVPIGDLVPGRHTLVSYDAKTNNVVTRMGGRNRTPGYHVVDKQVSDFDGNLVVIETDRSRSRVTPNHRVRVKFDDGWFNKFCVYLMNRGDSWRIGSSATQPLPYMKGTTIRQRLSAEKADGAWILDVCETVEEARFRELQLQHIFGIPGTTFTPNSSNRRDQDFYDRLMKLTGPFVDPRGRECLTAFGLEAQHPLFMGTRHPLYVKQKMVKSDSAFETVAANLVTGLFQMPVPISVSAENLPLKSKPDWLPATISAETYSGPVVSLEVENFEHYVSGGAVVHNSVKGGEADHVYLMCDLSAAGHRQWQLPGESRDALLRLYYVGLTRAREGVHIIPSTSHKRVDLAQFARPRMTSLTA